MIPIPEYPHDIPEVAQLDQDSAAGLATYIERYQPVLVRGAARSWPLFDRLARGLHLADRLRLIENLLGSAKVRYTLLPPEQHGDIGIGDDLRPNFRLDDRVASGSDFLAEVAELIEKPTGACAYAASLPLEDFPAIEDLVPRPEPVAGRPVWHRLLWIGSGRHIVDLHYDRMLNFITVLEGVKRITLVPPSALPYVYPAPLHRTAGGVPRSLVKVMNVDWQRFPRFKGALAVAQLATVEAGDLLFIPPLWWHYVESYGFNVMVNGWYSDWTAAQKHSLDAANRDFLRALGGSRGGVLEPPVARAAARQLIEATTHALDERAPVAEAGPPMPRAVKRTIRLARRSLASLPDYWRAWYQLQYAYYVFRSHGDPYPTLPGGLDEVVRHIRFGAARRLTTRVTRWPRRVAKKVLRALRGSGAPVGA